MPPGGKSCSSGLTIQSRTASSTDTLWTPATSANNTQPTNASTGRHPGNHFRRHPSRQSQSHTHPCRRESRFPVRQRGGRHPCRARPARQQQGEPPQRLRHPGHPRRHALQHPPDSPRRGIHPCPRGQHRSLAKFRLQPKIPRGILRQGARSLSLRRSLL